jgi:tryptophanyl-tRNA synthetase
MCGECKERASEMMKDFFKVLSKKREKTKRTAEIILNKD